MLRRSPHAIVAAMALLASTAWAQATYTWTGAAADGLPTTAANWSGNVAPTGNAADNWIFGDATNRWLSFNSPIAVGNIEFTGSLTYGYYSLYDSYPGGTILLSGGISITSPSKFAYIYTTVDLAAGSHAINPGTQFLGIWGQVSGSGGIVKNGSGYLGMMGTGSSYTGGTTTNAGTVGVLQNGALGTGVVTMANNTHLSLEQADPVQASVVLPNNFIFGSTAYFENYTSGQTDLILGNAGRLATTIAPSTGVSSVNFYNYYPASRIFLAGRFIDGDGPTSYSFTYGTFVLTGANSLAGGNTGGLYVQSDTRLLLDGPNAVPAAGTITTNTWGYAGLLGNSAAPTAVDTFVARIDPANFFGTFGLDTPKGSDPVAFNGAVNLSSFTNADVMFGTKSSAIYYGPIAPPTGAPYLHLNGAGRLFFQDEVGQQSYGLTGTYSLDLGNNDNTGGPGPLLAVFSRSAANTYEGLTNIGYGAGLVLDSPGAVPPAGSVNLNSGGYLGITGPSGVTPTQLSGLLNFYDSWSAIGFDSHDHLTNLAHPSVSDPLHVTTPTTVDVSDLDLSSLGNIYVGTATRASISGTLTTGLGGTTDYFFTGFDQGHLTVNSALSGTRAVYVGLPQSAESLTAFPTVELTNDANSYSGGTYLYSGRLVANASGMLGSGTLTVDPSYTFNGKAHLATTVSGTATLGTPIDLYSGYLLLEPQEAMNLTGTISGGPSTGLEVSGYGRTVTLSGNNTYSGTTTVSDRALLLAAGDTALGTSHANLSLGADLTFTSAAPSVGGLINGDPLDVPSLELFDPVVITLAGASGTVLTINNSLAGSYSSFWGDIVESGSIGSLVKTGAGTQWLGGYNGLTGGTTITQGTLAVGAANALGSGPITINGGKLAPDAGVVLTNTINFTSGKIGGNGTFGSAISVGSGTSLSPGNSPGTLTFSAGLTWAPGGTLDFEVLTAGGIAGTGYDTVNVTGSSFDITATSGTPFTVRLLSLSSLTGSGNVADFNPASAYSWLLATGNTTGGLNGFSADKFILDTSGFTNDLAGGQFYLLQGLSGGNPALYLNFAPVPEPSTVALLTAGALALGLAARRRRTS